jgi:putative transposase
MATTTVMRLSSADSQGKPGHRFDYKGMHRYYITLHVHHLRKVFTTNDVVLAVLDVLRDVAHAEQFDVYAYCFLPDRLVLIVRGRDEKSNMKTFLAALRARSSSVVEPRLAHPLWKRTYTERVLRKTEETRTVGREVLQIPVKAGLAARAADYQFSGSFVVDIRALT